MRTLADRFKMTRTEAQVVTLFKNFKKTLNARMAAASAEAPPSAVATTAVGPAEVPATEN